ncbi:hypothetical protein [Nibribacter koreensis]|uniref:PilZ domain-containing protein n=1 Tax=Nibribacter koreensis TaxID=1084519 RepID=A0ABP8FG87_9BACT
MKNRQEENQEIRFIIRDTFYITDRGIVFSGEALDGMVSAGDNLKFSFNGQIKEGQIIAVHDNRNINSDKLSFGLLLKFTDEREVETLRNWKPKDVEAKVVKGEKKNAL